MSDDTSSQELSEVGALGQQAAALIGRLGTGQCRVRVRSGDSDIELQWDGGPAPEASAGTHGADGAGAAIDPDGPDETVVSPMVGTFYRAPAPGADPFVVVGTTVDEGQVIGIVEAMKLMNPISTDVAGTVAAILVDDGESVEFGHPLVSVVPA